MAATAPGFMTRLIVLSKRLSKNAWVGSAPLAWAVQMSDSKLDRCGSAERVYVEREWYDGPRSGIADVHGVPHYFESEFDEGADDYLGTFRIWPIDAAPLALEIEQWRIFVDWNRRFESGEAGVDSHPGHGGVDARYDELEKMLKPLRAIPVSARKARAELMRLDRSERYAPSGPDYELRWSVF